MLVLLLKQPQQLLRLPVAINIVVEHLVHFVSVVNSLIRSSGNVFDQGLDIDLASRIFQLVEEMPALQLAEAGIDSS